MQDLDLAQRTMGAVELDRWIVAGNDPRLRGARIDQFQQVPLDSLQEAVAARGHEAVMVQAAEFEQLVEKDLPRMAEGGQQRVAQV